MTLNDENFLELLCAHIAMGGSPIDFCSTHTIPYNKLITWLNADAPSGARMKQYAAALDARNEWFIQRVMLEIGRISTIDIRKAFDDSGNLLNVKELPPELAAVVSNVEILETFEGLGENRVWIGYTKKIKFWDKMKALELLGKNLMMFIERHDHLVHGAVTIMPEIKVDDKPLRYNIGSPNPN